MQEELGKGVVHFHNKKGGTLMVMFIGDPSTVEKAHIISKIEEKCGLLYVGSREAQYKPEWEGILKSQYGDKLIVK